MAFLGIIGAGGVFAGTNPSYTPYELAHTIRTADVRYLLVEPSLLRNAISAAKSTSIPLSRIIVFNPPGSDAATQSSPLQSQHALHDWQWLLSHGSSDWYRFSDHATATSTTATRLFSSGTTGLPKALNLTHHNLIAQHTLVMEHPSYAPRRLAAYTIRRLLCTPMFHVSQVCRTHATPLRSGDVSVVMRRFEVAAWLRNIERFAITEVNTVPMMVNAVVNSDLPGKPGYSMATLRNSWCGAAPLRKEQQARFRKLLREDCPFNQVWGMSETSGIATMLYWPEEDRTGGVGRNIPNVDAKVVDDKGEREMHLSTDFFHQIAHADENSQGTTFPTTTSRASSACEDRSSSRTTTATRKQMHETLTPTATSIREMLHIATAQPSPGTSLTGRR